MVDMDEGRILELEEDVVPSVVGTTTPIVSGAPQQ